MWEKVESLCSLHINWGANGEQVALTHLSVSTVTDQTFVTPRSLWWSVFGSGRKVHRSVSFGFTCATTAIVCLSETQVTYTPCCAWTHQDWSCCSANVLLLLIAASLICFAFTVTGAVCWYCYCVFVTLEIKQFKEAAVHSCVKHCTVFTMQEVQNNLIGQAD